MSDVSLKQIISKIQKRPVMMELELELMQRFPRTNFEEYYARVRIWQKEVEGDLLKLQKQLEDKLVDFEKRYKKTPYPHGDIDALILLAGRGLVQEILGVEEK
jgi:hypothetical protein